MPRDISKERKRIPVIAWIAAIVALLMAIGGFAMALRQIGYALNAIIPAIAGILILRRRVWGAWGYAVYSLAQGIITPLAFTVSRITSPPLLVAQAVLGIILAALFFFAGRALKNADAPRGSAWPWIVAAILLSVPFFFVHTFVNPSGGMENTILPGDRFLARVFPRGKIERGEIVVFRYPLDRRQIYIKRVIGVPGDHLRMVSQTVYRNGQSLNEPYAVHKFHDSNAFRDNLPADPQLLRGSLPPPELGAVTNMFEHHVFGGEIVVPPDKYFVLGDNRDNSLDSRYWGFLDEQDVLGTPLLIYDSETINAAGHRSVRWNRIFKPR